MGLQLKKKAMRCPSCGSPWHREMEARHTDNHSVSRKRKCHGCEHAWFTAEVSVHPDHAGFTQRHGGYRKEQEMGVKSGLLRQLAELARQPIKKAG